ncbi:MAG: DNA-directed RNA polymerase subunit RpoH/Rpb5 C-terminal domain-containing protein [Candidatus Woesearchaeota archaeon]
MAHNLVPKHEKLSEKETKALFEKFKMEFKYLPKISVADAALEGLEAKEGDIIRIKRKSATAGDAEFFRGVVKE